MCIFLIILPFWHNLAFFKLAMIFLLLLYDEIRTHVCEQDFARFKLVKTICPVRLCGRAYLLSSKIVFKRCSNVNKSVSTQICFSLVIYLDKIRCLIYAKTSW